MAKVLLLLGLLILEVDSAGGSCRLFLPRNVFFDFSLPGPKVETFRLVGHSWSAATCLFGCLAWPQLCLCSSWTFALRTRFRLPDQWFCGCNPATPHPSVFWPSKRMTLFLIHNLNALRLCNRTSSPPQSPLSRCGPLPPQPWFVASRNPTTP
jgi:hypothetical protein